MLRGNVHAWAVVSSVDFCQTLRTPLLSPVTTEESFRNRTTVTTPSWPGRVRPTLRSPPVYIDQVLAPRSRIKSHQRTEVSQNETTLVEPNATCDVDEISAAWLYRFTAFDMYRVEAMVV